MESPFHLAFPVKNIESTKFFYKEVLGCEIGREDKKWVDFNFFGHQLSAHLKPDELKKTKENLVDGKSVPVRHFGVILPWEKWQLLSKKLIKINTKFIIDPYVRFEGEVGEQATMFFLDPSGNALEFKSFKDSSQIFAK
ncbi:MAG: glyoxalase [Cytophagia bacterium]|nr:glyoxalase [Cytophagia bacterium]